MVRRKKRFNLKLSKLDGVELPGLKKVKNFSCECLDCGKVVKSEEHCIDLKCSACGGKMRRVSRPGIGKKVSEKGGGNESNLLLQVRDFSSYLLPEPITIDEVSFEKGQELRMVTGVVLEPDVVDGQGDIYNAEEIRKTAHSFMADYTGQGNGFMHKSFGDPGIPIVESYIAPVNFRVGKELVLKGSWLMTSLVLDDKKWEAVKSGKLTGYSIRGRSKTKYEE